MLICVLYVYCIYVYMYTGCTGSLRYMAPEVALNESYNEKVDMYSYAIILYEVITCCIPFPGFTTQDFYTSVVDDDLRPDLLYDNFGHKLVIRPKIQNIITQCWSSFPTHRLTSEQAYNIIKDEEIEAIKIDNKNFIRSSLRKTAMSLFGKKDTI